MLRSLNISNAVVDWFCSYLTGRRQCVRVDDQTSSFCDIASGVPQGGVLSPLLFSLFINFITPLLHCQYHLYADDLQIYTQCSVEDIASGIDRINIDLCTILDWSRSHGLAVNPSKSQVIILGGSKQLARFNTNSLPPVVFDNAVLAYCRVVKNLGILFDSSLSWSQQVSEVSRKIFAAAGSLKRWKNLLPVKTKIQLAQTLLLPILDYADTCYLDLNEDLLDKLQRMQNLCIRFIFGLRKFDHISAFRAQLGWLPIRLRRDAHTAALVYNILHNPLTPAYLTERFNFLGFEHNRTVRSKFDNVLKAPFTRSGYYKESFTVQATHIWNALPREIRHCTSLDTFKIKVHQHFMTKSVR
ncbi:hypothetical protein O0L34_g3626 [Tuta absoluta]|nr:hypothetical protein O0L34_g3626 [Tuta absoluta]